MKISVLMLIIIVICSFVLFQGCSLSDETPVKNELTLLNDEEEAREYNVSTSDSVAIFSGGCFVCLEKLFEEEKGVKEVLTGYSSNSSQDKEPYYRAVASGKTNFRETIAIFYDDSATTYEELVNTFLKVHDPTDDRGSFHDRGFQYTSAIYYQNEEEKNTAQEVITDFEEANIYVKPIVTSVEPLKNFYIAEGNYQNYYAKNPNQYELYRISSGRVKHIKDVEERMSELSN